MEHESLITPPPSDLARSDTEPPASIDKEFDSLPPPELVQPDSREQHEEIDPTPELIEAVRTHFAHKRMTLVRQVLAIEEMLGFIDVSGELAERVAKLERFVGMKG